MIVVIKKIKIDTKRRLTYPIVILGNLLCSFISLLTEFSFLFFLQLQSLELGSVLKLKHTGVTDVTSFLHFYYFIMQKLLIKCTSKLEIKLIQL